MRVTPEEETTLLEAARLGDETAYEALVGGHRRELHAHCYRMLASLHDADDAVQETMIRAWRGLERFESRSSVRTWLYKIATNVALDLLAKRRRRELPVLRGEPVATGASPGEALLDVPWIEPYPDRLIDESQLSPEARVEQLAGLELAFVAAIQYVPPRQRAVLVLREVLEFSATEVAELLDTTVASVNSSLQRAHASAASRLPATSQQVELERLGSEGVRELARRYAESIDRGDVASLLSILTEDATWSMPPHPNFYEGLASIGDFHRRSVSKLRWRHAATTANGQLAIGCYIFDDDRATYVGSVLDVLTLRDGRVASVTAFFTPDEDADEGAAPSGVEFARFGLADTIDE